MNSGMNKKTALPIVALVALGLAGLGAKSSCSCHWSTAKITKATLSDKVDSDRVQAIGQKDSFGSDATKIYYVVTYKNCPKDTKITATWKYLGGPAGSPKPQVIDRPVTKTVRGSGRIAFSLSKPTRGFPPGKYEVLVKLDDKQVRHQSFSVTAAKGGAHPSRPSSGRNGPSAAPPRQARPAR